MVWGGKYTLKGQDLYFYCMFSK